MLPPHRHASRLDSPLELKPLPHNQSWSGKIAYLDRDGVLNRWSDNYVNSPEEVEILPNSGESVARLRRHGFRICVVTNQSPIGRGLWGHDTLELIHKEIENQLLEEDIDAILDLVLYSPYHPSENSWARKPNPGMLEAGRQIIEASENIEQENIKIMYGPLWVERPSESSSVMVGDQISDIEAGKKFGVNAIQCDQTIGISDVIDQIVPKRG